MGQQESQSFRQQPHEHNRNQHLSNYSTNKHPQRQKHKQQRVQHEGVLRLENVPFKNCIEISPGEEQLFLENVDTTLKYLIDSRLNTNMLFPVADIERLIESIVYTLAYLQSKGITYSDVASENVFYDDGQFKMLPNQLIQTNSYEKLLLSHLDRSEADSSNFVCASPEMIIAYRCKEKSIHDPDILQKSNIFALGMMLLEATTLLPACECYDPENYDILDSVISDRLILIEEFYQEKIARIIANMLDYDYVERMDMKQLSIWINRELNSDKNHIRSSQVTPTKQSLARSSTSNLKNQNSHQNEDGSRILFAKNASDCNNNASDCNNNASDCNNNASDCNNNGLQGQDAMLIHEMSGENSQSKNISRVKGNINNNTLAKSKSAKTNQIYMMNNNSKNAANNMNCSERQTYYNRNLNKEDRNKIYIHQNEGEQGMESEGSAPYQYGNRTLTATTSYPRNSKYHLEYIKKDVKGSQQYEEEPIAKHSLDRIHQINHSIGELDQYKLNEKPEWNHRPDTYQKEYHYKDTYPYQKEKIMTSTTKRLAKQPEQNYKYQEQNYKYPEQNYKYDENPKEPNNKYREQKYEYDKQARANKHYIMNETSKEESLSQSHPLKPQEQPDEELNLHQTRKGQKTPLKETQNKYYPSVDQLYKPKPNQPSNGYPQTSYDSSSQTPESESKIPQRGSKAYQPSKQNIRIDQNYQVVHNDQSMNRIKLEIQKSRKMIEGFRKSEGIQY